jgi:hypothetical protein
VKGWLLWMERRNSLPRVDSSRFLMNGKALCLMSLSMFTYRVPLGGKLLYKDFQLRLSLALHTEAADQDHHHLVALRSPMASMTKF